MTPAWRPPIAVSVSPVWQSGSYLFADVRQLSLPVEESLVLQGFLVALRSVTFTRNSHKPPHCECPEMPRDGTG